MAEKPLVPCRWLNVVSLHGHGLDPSTVHRAIWYDNILYYISHPLNSHPSLFCTVEALMTVSHPKAITPSHYVTGDDPKALPLSRPSSYALAFTFSTASHWKHPRNLMVLCYAPSRGDMLNCLIQCWPNLVITMKCDKKMPTQIPRTAISC